MGSFLRSLTPEQQVSLLFVGVFGLLLLASVAGVLIGLTVPGGAVALTAVLGGPAIHRLELAFAFGPVLVNSVSMVLLALLFNHLAGRRYPHHAVPTLHRTSDPLPTHRTGVLPTDLPAIYVDLDTLVFGDLGQALALMDTPQTVAMLQSAIIPFGPVGRFIHRRTEGRKYARGNSSLVVFHPAQCHYIAQRFRELFAQHPDLGYRPMAADERFISWAAQPHMKALSGRFAVKLTLEYMSRIRVWLWIKPLLPWIRSRRRQQVAVTLNGIDIKPENLMKLRDGDVVTDNKGRALIWSGWTLGAMRQRILDFYTGVV